MYDIISIGSATRDVFIQADAVKVKADADSKTGQALCLNLGSKIKIDKIVFTTGGGATNTATTFARQGLKSACISLVGDDPEGREIIRTLEQEGIDVSFIKKHADDVTAYSVVLVDKGGERTILSYKGEGEHLGQVDIPFDRLATEWLFISSLGGNLDLLKETISWAKANEIKIATNPGGTELAHGAETLGPIYGEIDILVMNQEEAADLTGISFDSEQAIFEALDKMITGVVVMTKGPKGVVVSDKKSIYRAGVPDSPRVERTGAGDAWSAGFVSEFILRQDIEKAIQFATANASSVVTQFGAKAGILRKDD